MPDPDGDDRLHDLGAFIRAQRQLANLSLRQMADLAHVSNPYLSQLERGLHEPSVRVLQSISRALNLSAETLLAHAGVVDDPAARGARHRGGHPPRPVAHRRPEAGPAVRVPELRAGQRGELIRRVSW